MKTVFVGMSGGVDSSVTAGILRDQNYSVVGVHLRCFNVDGCAKQDAEDARHAAETLGIPLYMFDFEKEYREKVVEYMIDGYCRGITPNPDVVCNREIKFGLFLKKALEMGAYYVATGHYIRLRRIRLNPRIHHSDPPAGGEESAFALFAARDRDKDQSYFLWTLTQKQLAHCLFPLGNLIKKTDVRRLARKYKLPNAKKKDSQGICFLGAVHLPEFLGRYIPARQGAIVNTAGEKLGEHRGAHFYTIGQRHGLGVGGSATPLYVAEKNIRANIVTIAEEGSDSLYRHEITLSHANFISPLFAYSNELTNNKKGVKVYVRVRYRQPLFPARLIIRNSLFVIQFEIRQRSVAEGQSAVFYAKNGEMLGGGIIEKTR